MFFYFLSLTFHWYLEKIRKFKKVFGYDFKLQSHVNILTFRWLFISFVVSCISMFFNIVSATKSTREVQVTYVPMKIVLVITYRWRAFADKRFFGVLDSILHLQKKRRFCWRQSCYLKNEYYIPWCFVTSNFPLTIAVIRK